MPRSGETYSLPANSWINAVAGTTMSSADFDTLMADIATAITGSVARAGGSMTGPLLMGNGGAGAPSISFTNDPDTGFYRSTSNELLVALGGVATHNFKAGAVVGDNNTSVMTAAMVKATTDLLAPKAGPTFTGTVTLPSTTSIGTVTNTEISYLSGVTSAIQTQLNAKAALAGPTFTGTVTLPSTTSIGTVSATEIGYLDNVTSAIQTQLNAKAPTASPTFTGVITNGRPFVGPLLVRVNGTGTTIDAQNGSATVSTHSSTGVYVITHGLGTASFVAFATAADASRGYICAVTATDATTLTVTCTNDSNTKTDIAFNLLAIPYA